MKTVEEEKQNGTDTRLPESFRPLFWSYDLTELDLETHKKTIIVNVINYGDLPHWRWLVSHYGKDEIRAILEQVPVSELRPRVRRLVSLMFDINAFNHAPRGAH